MGHHFKEGTIVTLSALTGVSLTTMFVVVRRRTQEGDLPAHGMGLVGRLFCLAGLPWLNRKGQGYV